MITVRFVFIICLINCFSYSQKIKINGVLFEKINSNDSIILLSDSSIKDEYYEKTYLIREIKNNSFYLKNEITYPQMFRVRLKSETNKIPNRRGFYFLDKTSTYIKIDSLKIAGEVVGEIGNEFKNEFTPFFIKDNTNQDNFDSILFKENNFFDIKLLDYVIKHNNSFIALWFFIYDFSNTGYSDLKK